MKMTEKQRRDRAPTHREKNCQCTPVVPNSSGEVFVCLFMFFIHRNAVTSEQKSCSIQLLSDENTQILRLSSHGVVLYSSMKSNIHL